MHRHRRPSRRNLHLQPHRRGILMVFAALLMVIILTFMAFVVDTGYIATTKGQMQNAVDAAALAGVTELVGAMGPNPGVSWTQAKTNGQSAATDMTQANANGNSGSTAITPARDIRWGRRTWNTSTSTWNTTWSSSPYNLVEVTALRQSTDNNLLPLFFAGVFGRSNTDLSVIASASLNSAGGFRSGQPGAKNVMMLPIAMDLDSWNTALSGSGADNYNWNGSVVVGADGVEEVNLFPTTFESEPSGNSGIVNFGSASNSTADVSRQIMEGLNISDLSSYGGELRVDTGPIYVWGEPGISIGFEDELLSIVGQRRLVPLFSDVTGNGERAQYKIVRFAGCRVLAVRLKGAMNRKYVIVQPESFIDPTAIPSKFLMFNDTVFTASRLVQ